MENFVTYRFQLTYRLPDNAPERSTLAEALEGSGARMIENCPVPANHVVIEFRRHTHDPSLALMQAVRLVRKQIPGAEVVASSPVLPDR